MPRRPPSNKIQPDLDLLIAAADNLLDHEDPAPGRTGEEQASTHGSRDEDRSTAGDEENEPDNENNAELEYRP